MVDTSRGVSEEGCCGGGYCGGNAVVEDVVVAMEEDTVVRVALDKPVEGVQRTSRAARQLCTRLPLLGGR
jgi:hypothetical protein